MKTLNIQYYIVVLSRNTLYLTVKIHTLNITNLAFFHITSSLLSFGQNKTLHIYSKVQKSLPSVFQLFISNEMMDKKIKYIQR